MTVDQPSKAPGRPAPQPDPRAPDPARRRRARSCADRDLQALRRRAGRSATRDITIQAGQVHALVGENGAGKSTMIKIISGVESADTGHDRVRGRGRSPSTPPATRWRSGIATVYQEPQLFPELTVVGEHLHRPRDPQGRPGRLGASRTPRWSSCWSCSACRPGTPPCRSATLSIAEQQQVSIAKALAGDAKVLILDEPSAILTDAEIEVLFGVVRRLTASGVSVIYISHRLDELFRIADEVTVMRDGQTIGTYPIGELTVRQIAELMVGGILSDERAAAGDPGRRPGAGARRPGPHRQVPRRRRRGPRAARSSGSTAWSARASPRSPPASTASTAPPAARCGCDGKRIAPRSPRGGAEAGHRAAAGQPQARGHVLLPVDRVQHLGRAPEAALPARHVRRPGARADGGHAT